MKNYIKNKVFFVIRLTANLIAYQLRIRKMKLKIWFFSWFTTLAGIQTYIFTAYTMKVVNAMSNLDATMIDILRILIPTVITFAGIRIIVRITREAMCGLSFFDAFDGLFEREKKPKKNKKVDLKKKTVSDGFDMSNENYYDKKENVK